MNAQVLLLLGLAYSLGMIATLFVAAVYLAVHGNPSGLAGLAIAAVLCCATGRFYLWMKAS
jgi:hypothetical protein